MIGDQVAVVPIDNYDHFIQAFNYSLVLLQPFFRALVLSDIVGYAAHDRGSHTLGAQSVVIFPDSALTPSRQNDQEASRFAGLLNASQILIKLKLEFGSDNLPHGNSKQFFNAVTQDTRRCRIRREKVALQIVNA